MKIPKQEYTAERSRVKEGLTAARFGKRPVSAPSPRRATAPCAPDTDRVCLALPLPGQGIAAIAVAHGAKVAQLTKDYDPVIRDLTL